MTTTPREPSRRSSLVKRIAALFGCLILVAAAAPAVLASDASATTTNNTPSVGAAYFYTSAPSATDVCPATGRATSFNPTAGAVTTVYVCIEASDGNGWNDICDATSTTDVRTFTVKNATDVVVSDATHPKENVALTCATGSGTAVAMTASFEMEYWRPTGLAASTTAYKIAVTLTDVAGATAPAFSQNFDYASLKSLDTASAASIGLGGALAPGAEGAEATATLYNKGNVDFTVQAAGTALTGTSHGQTIAVGNLKWATATGTYSGKTAMTTSAVSTGLSAPAETADGTTARTLYLQLAAPAGSAQWIPADTYQGTVTFSAS